MSLPEATVTSATLSDLAGGWRIYQLPGGNRWSTDDLLLAGWALQAAPGARRALDLGAGVGSVGLLALRQLPEDARLVMVEAQEISADLAAQTVALNGLGGRARVRRGDLRDPGVLAGEAPFELITANPPYLPPQAATASPHPQRAAARLELRGNIYDYCVTAARHLAPGGAFCFCHAAGDPRPPRAIAAAGLALRARRAVAFRRGKAPTIALYRCGWGPAEAQDLPPLVVREGDGAWTEEYARVRAALALADDPRPPRGER